MDHLQYFLILNSSLVIFYVVYKIFYKREGNFYYLRYYLLSIILISVILPFFPFTIELNNTDFEYITGGGFIQEISNEPSLINNTEVIDNTPKEIVARNSLRTIDWFFYMKMVYFFISFFLLFRLVFQILIFIFQFRVAEKKRIGKYTLVYTKKFKSVLTFFHWIFIPQHIKTDEQISQILAHEKIHARQLHSIDLILIELLAAVMWFNPVVWKLRNTVQLVHEYLADKGALDTGIDKLSYQALLLNQVAEERLVSLFSGFNPVRRPGNHSLIKKRMIMMTKSKFNHNSKLRILALIPVTLIMILGVACVNGQKKSDVVAAVAPVKMNIFYLGVDNPVSIAVSGYDAKDIEVSIENGKIRGENGEYIVNPHRPGISIVKVSCNGEIIKETRFRVKLIPDPVAVVPVSAEGRTDFVSGGKISVDDLLDAGKIETIMRNFDFDLRFRVVSFVVSATIPGSNTVREEISINHKFTEKQIDLIKSLEKNQKLMIEEIFAVGPDGKKRKMNSMVFTIE